MSEASGLLMVARAKEVAKEQMEKIEKLMSLKDDERAILEGLFVIAFIEGSNHGLAKAEGVFLRNFEEELKGI